MANFITSWILELVDKISAPMRKVQDSIDQSQKGADGLQESIKKLSAMDVYAMAQSVGDLTRAIEQAAAPGIAFNSQIKEVQAITGLTGDNLDKLAKSARENAKIFGGDAASMLDSYKGIISRLGPDIAKSDVAMSEMGKNVATLSKLMGGDAVSSMDALTTAMLQFGVDLSDPIAASQEMERMMNVMAAAGNEGASEVDMTAEALKQAGVQAKNSNVSFEQVNSALQILAEGGLTGSEAGIKLRNVLSKMAGEDVIPQEAAEKLRALGVNFDIVSDKTIPFTDRLRELKKAQGDATIMAQIFGIQNDAAAQILLNNIDAQDQLTEKITGTSAATEGAEIIMSSYSETVNRIKAWFSDFGIELFNTTQYILPFISGIGSAVVVLANMANAAKSVKVLFGLLKTMPSVSMIVKGGFTAMSGAATKFGVALTSIPVVGWIIGIIAALGALAVYFWKTSAEFRGALMGMWEAVKAIFSGIGSFIGETLSAIKKMLVNVFNPKNWFNSDYSITDDLARIGNIAKSYGESIGKAFLEGQEKGRASFEKEKTEKEGGKTSTAGKIGGVVPPEDIGVSSSNNSTNTSRTNSGVKNGKQTNGLSLSGAGGSGGGRSITMNLTMTNNFNGTSEDVAMKIVRQINDRLQDAAAAI
ncbi:phage tail tape measure protein [Porphyromonas levii]|uniref:phage tail tape measure protein n=1 Tax=Porphyromonas levii TaxID=28114 RepID=UPI001B8C4098|nr:phage tail tape measure protein [Porphyromonas levii]MBR8759275.1 hypothetical protein [Porphyromonas levii]